MNDRRCDVCQGRGCIEGVPCRICGGSGWWPSPGDKLPPIGAQPWNDGVNAKAKIVDKARKEWEDIQRSHTPGPVPHFHRNRLGILEACYHRVTPKGWATGLLLWTISFPFEHLLWTRAPGFSAITQWMGL